MKRTTIILFLLLTKLLCFGQMGHLVPAKDFNRYEGILKEYYDTVFPLLYSGFSKRPFARYTSMPSFSSEYAFSVEEIDGKFYIISNEFSESYWYALYENKRNSVKVYSTKTEIKSELYFRMRELFKLLGELTKEIKEIEEIIFGEDGITYYFATTDKNGRIRISETWSPPDDSLLDRLVKICDNLYLIGNKKDILQIDIFKELDKLISDLK